MYKKAIFSVTSIDKNNNYEGETIEDKVRRIMNNGEPITDGAPIIYQDRQVGVEPAYDIRTNKLDVAMDGMDKVNEIKQRTRKKLIDEFNEKNNPKTEKTDKPSGEHTTSGGENQTSQN